MVSELDSVFLHDAVEHLDFCLSFLIKDEAMIDGSGFTVRTFSFADGRVALARTAHVVTVIVVGIDGCNLIARNITFLKELLDRNGVFLTVHVADHEDRNSSEFSLDDFSLSKNQPDL